MNTNHFEYGGKTYKVGGTYYTDYPFKELGDTPYQYAPVRSCKILRFDGDRGAVIIINDIVTSIKVGYLHESLDDLQRERLA